MPQQKQDGGAAFPRVCSTPSDFVWPGMSVRKYFAGAGISGPACRSRMDGHRAHV